jgi:site-specific recombinase XerD
MSPLREHLDDYLIVRRSMGYKLARAEKLLEQFIDYLDAHGATTVTTDHALAWATLPAGSRAWWAIRMSALRSFARYLHVLDERHEIPPSDLLTPRTASRVPYLYSDQELAALLGAAGAITSEWRVVTIRTLLGLLSVTGMRIGEAIAADHEDFDADQGLLLVRHGKYGKQRLLPLHATTTNALRGYLHHPVRPRDRDCQALFVSTVGTRLHYSHVNRTFVRLVRTAGLKPRSARCTPRVHDIRHTFAVNTLLDYYRADIDAEGRLPLLSTYMGHVKPKDTYWYLTAAPELLALAGQRLETSLGEAS